MTNPGGDAGQTPSPETQRGCGRAIGGRLRGAADRAVPATSGEHPPPTYDAAVLDAPPTPPSYEPPTYDSRRPFDQARPTRRPSDDAQAVSAAVPVPGYGYPPPADPPAYPPPEPGTGLRRRLRPLRRRLRRSARLRCSPGIRRPTAACRRTARTARRASRPTTWRSRRSSRRSSGSSAGSVRSSASCWASSRSTRSRHPAQSGRGLAIAGIAVGAGSLLISLIWTVAILGS